MTETTTNFEEFPKVARYSRQCIVTEKIDGTNAQVCITQDEFGMVFQAGSRTRWVTTDNDNHGFARWVLENREDLKQLGPGRHFGEWWGQGIQRGYGLTEKRFSLFNVIRWDPEMFYLFKWLPWSERVGQKDRGEEPVFKQPPSCCYVVPVILRGRFGDMDFDFLLRSLSIYGSHAAPGFMKPEGIVIYHTAGGVMFKKTIYHDEGGKGS